MFSGPLPPESVMGEPHVVSALVRKRAELAGEIEEAEKRIAQLRADLVHVDAVLRLFDPAAKPEAIPAKRPWRRTGWFADGELPRRVLDTLRTAPEPLSAGEIALRIMAAKGLDAGDARALEVIRDSVRRFLAGRKDGLVRRTGGNGRDVRWRVAG
jgi:hypothetical protein